MKTLKLYEEYINSSSNRVNTFLKNLVKSLNDSFSGTNNALGTKDIENIALIDVEQSNTNDAYEKNILMRFSDNTYQYQMIFVIKIQDIKDNDPIKDGYMKLKIYDGNDADLLREWQSDLTIEESSDEDMNSEGRWFVKVGEKKKDDTQSEDSQSEDTQVQSSDLDYIESFILSKIGFLKEMLEPKTDGPQLENDVE
jgi:hypothetical protein